VFNTKGLLIFLKKILYLTHRTVWHSCSSAVDLFGKDLVRMPTASLVTLREVS